MATERRKGCVMQRTQFERDYVRTWSFIIVWNSSLLCHILLYNWCLWHEIKEKIMHIQIFFPPHITIQVIQEWNLLWNCYWKTGWSPHLLETLLQFACWMVLRTDSRQAILSFSVHSWFEFWLLFSYNHRRDCRIGTKERAKFTSSSVSEGFFLFQYFQ